MSVKSLLSLAFAKFILFKNNKWKNNAVNTQKKIMLNLVNKAQDTVFGKDHDFSKIQNYNDFKTFIPIRDYEGLKPYVEQIIDGKENVLWPGKPLYFSKTSGTTSGEKYIPISLEGLPNHIKAARDAMLSYIAETKKAGFVDGKMIFFAREP